MLFSWERVAFRNSVAQGQQMMCEEGQPNCKNHRVLTKVPKVNSIIHYMSEKADYALGVTTVHVKVIVNHYLN